MNQVTVNGQPYTAIDESEYLLTYDQLIDIAGHSGKDCEVRYDFDSQPELRRGVTRSHHSSGPIQFEDEVLVQRGKGLYKFTVTPKA